MRGRTILFNALGLIAILVTGRPGRLFVRYWGPQKNTFYCHYAAAWRAIPVHTDRYPVRPVRERQQRLEWIIAKIPSFPGAQEKLTEVLVLSNQPTPHYDPFTDTHT